MKQKRLLYTGIFLIVWLAALLGVGGIRAAACDYPQTVEVILHNPPEKYCLQLDGDAKNNDSLEEYKAYFLETANDLFKQEEERAALTASGLVESDWNYRADFAEMLHLKQDGDPTEEGIRHTFSSISGQIRDAARIFLVTGDGEIMTSAVFSIQAHRQTVVFDCKEQTILRTQADDSGYQSYLRQREKQAAEDRMKTLPYTVIICVGWLAVVLGIYMMFTDKPVRNLYVLLPDWVLQGGCLIAVGAALLYQNERLVGNLLLYVFTTLGVIRLAVYPALLRGQHWFQRILYWLLVTAASYGAALLMFGFARPPVYI